MTAPSLQLRTRAAPHRSRSDPLRCAHRFVLLRFPRRSVSACTCLPVRFPHGPPPHLTKPELAEDIEFKMFANPEDRKVRRGDGRGWSAQMQRREPVRKLERQERVNSH